MASGRFISYHRVSTQAQGRSGLGLEAQQAAVAQWLNGGSWDLVAEYVEVETGTRKGNKRPELAKALAHCRKVGATLVIAKLDRLARNVAFVSGLMEAGVEFVAVDMPHANKLTVHILAAVAEDEAERISARTKAALAAAKARGVKLGNPANLTAEARARGAVQGGQAAKAKAVEAYADLAGRVASLHAAGSSLRAIAVTLNSDGITTRNGAAFTAATVARILGRQA
ncbi:MAG: recombinase family protein [Candidatus Sericytochromatia bacterium]|uniref:Recombinase family protein n=1 Tax=Candidatus Tanganyikabacteria bacterium TaxID=2961651 RepID=A0A938BLT5_9BACT|nr:recombinase family protein [Candidatus Tanganyikabacteria bacterium]